VKFEKVLARSLYSAAASHKTLKTSVILLVVKQYSLLKPSHPFAPGKLHLQNHSYARRTFTIGSPKKMDGI